MVDSTKGIGSVQGVPPVSKNQSVQGKRSETAKAPSAPVDTVEISAKALDLAAAEQAAKDVGSYLDENRQVTLGLDASFFDEVA